VYWRVSRPSGSPLGAIVPGVITFTILENAAMQTDHSRRDAIRIMTVSAATLAAGASYARQPGDKSAPPSGTGGLKPEVLTRPIPSTGEKVPVVGLGTWQVFDVESTPEKLAPLEDVLKVFHEMGGSLIDSSPMYGHSETVVGNLITKLNLRPKMFIATKVWTTGKEKGVAQMEESERRLQAKPLDLIQVHNLVDTDAHLETLGEWKKQKRVRYVGITHYTASAHDAVCAALEKHTVDFVQINYSIGEREAEKRVLPLAKERGVAVLANRPFVSGAMFRRLKDKPIPEWAKEIDCDSWAQLMLKFVVSHPAVTCAIPATNKAEHMRDNMKACVGRLPDEAMRAKIASVIA
jgi:diketogulonate reductase-like aldo/keto reductase